MAERERKERGWERYKDKISENPRIGKKWSDTEREREREREREKPRRIHYIRRIPSHLKSNYIINRIESSSCTMWLKVTNYTCTYKCR